MEVHSMTDTVAFTEICSLISIWSNQCSKYARC